MSLAVAEFIERGDQRQYLAGVAGDRLAMDL